LFKGANLLAKGRLLHIQARGGTGEMSLFGHHDEIAQMTKFHGGVSRDKTLLSAARSGQAVNMPNAAVNDNNNK
jgi:hypothetical protein